MSKLFNLLEAAHHFERLAHGWPNACHAALEACAQVVEAECKAAIGTYKYGWQQLAKSTQADRVHAGFPANEPLLRTGRMRDTISHWSTPKEAQVGTNDKIWIYQELGTRTIPPRPVFGNVAKAVGPKLTKIVGKTLRDYLAAENMHHDFIHLALEALHKIGEMLREAAEDLVRDPDEPRRKH